MNIYLGDHYEEYIRKQIATGRFTSAAEVMRDALREHENKTKLEKLRAHLAEAQAEYDRGEGKPMTADFWDELDREIEEDIRLGKADYLDDESEALSDVG